QTALRIHGKSTAKSLRAHGAPLGGDNGAAVAAGRRITAQSGQGGKPGPTPPAPCAGTRKNAAVIRWMSLYGDELPDIKPWPREPGKRPAAPTRIDDAPSHLKQHDSGGVPVMMGAARLGLGFLLALRTQGPDFGFVSGQRKACARHAFGQLTAHGGVADFCYRPAPGAYHQQVMRRAGRVVAGCPGV